jgi:DNA-binding transcriptional ArsR family regulator
MALDALASLLRALSDPCRLRLLLLCAAQPASVSALAAALGETEPTISRHLKALAAAGVLRRTRRGQRVEYSRATGTPFDELIAAALRTTDGGDALLDAARARLATEGRGGEATRGASIAQSVRTSHGGGDEQRLGDALALAMEQALGARASGAAPGVAADAASAVAPVAPQLLLCAGQFPLRAVQRLVRAGAPRLLLVADTVAERTAQRRRLADAALEGEAVLRGDLPRLVAATATDGSALQSCVDLRAVRSWGEVESLLRWLQRLPVARSADWLLFDYDSAEAAVGAATRNLPAELRARLTSLGFDARRIQPVEADGQHRLFVHCVPRSAGAARAA